MNVDRSTWRPRAFAEIAQNISIRVDNPSKSGLARYVGLEHLDPGCLTIRRWGDPSQVEATKLRFKSGDVVFGKRRAYQRKASLADFEGICSAHAFVLRAQATTHGHFLPILVQSSDFLGRSIAISVGSLSPTINWRDLARQIFLLPPKDEQDRISKLVWAAEQVTVRAEHAAAAAWDVEKRLLEDIYTDPTWPTTTVGEAGDVQLGKMLNSRNQTGRHARPYLRAANVGDDDFSLDDLLSMDFSDKEFEKFELASGDILLVEGSGATSEIGRPALWQVEVDGCGFQKTLLRFRANANVLPCFAYGWFRRAYYRGDFARNSSKTTSLGHLTAMRFKKMPFPVPPLDVQHKIVERVAEAREARRRLEKHAANSRRLVHALIDRILGEDDPPDELR